MFWRILFFIGKIFILLTLPFILLIRGAVYLHEVYQYHAWLALGGGMIAMTVVLFIYLTFLKGRLSGKWEGALSGLRRRGVTLLILVLGYCAYGLFYFSNKNAKVPEVQKEYTSLHPILRVSVSTILFIDKDLMMTDSRRQPEDYKKMGLPSKKKSLHYPQSNGYVHAFDIRTNGRAEWRNKALQIYFSLMGFNTLRHGGTGDHLHVSLKSFDSPGSI